MFRFAYTLDSENFRELSDYLALHDRKIQKKMVSLMISLSSIAAIVLLLIFRITWLAALLILLSVVLILVFFPKLYWAIIFNRTKRAAADARLQFHPTTVEFQNAIRVQDGTKLLEIPYGALVNADFTKNNCIIFYRAKEVQNTLLIPVAAIGDALQSFYQFLQEELPDDKNRGNT